MIRSAYERMSSVTQSHHLGGTELEAGEPAYADGHCVSVEAGHVTEASCSFPFDADHEEHCTTVPKPRSER